VSKAAELHLLTDDTYAAALAYLPTIPDEQESLFDLAVSSIQERVRMLGRAVGIPNLSPHDCRHSWSDRAARSGATLDALMQAGGWSNYQTPLGYLKRRAISNDGIKL
jgi:integrase